MITLAHRPCLPSSLIHLAPCSKRHHGALICGDDVHCFSWDFFDRRPRGLAPADSPPESPADRPQVASLTGSLQEAMQGMDEDSTQRPPQVALQIIDDSGHLSSFVTVFKPAHPKHTTYESGKLERLMCNANMFPEITYDLWRHMCSDSRAAESSIITFIGSDTI